MDFEEKKYWVGFNVFEGIGPARFKLLYDFFGSAEKAFNAPEKELNEIGLGEGLTGRFIEFRKSFDFEDYFLRMEKLGIFVLCSVEEEYPKLLKEIVGGPPVIYVREGQGEPEGPHFAASDAASRGKQEGQDIFNKKAVAVVGTRKVTGYGRQVTEMITEGLVANGLVVVSGLARGVDEVAHETAIKYNGLTIAVLGCGLDMIYPPEHKPLADKIVQTGGRLVSEYCLGTKAMPGNFPARNRIISGLSLGVVVTEAAEDSGSLITASDAAEQGREVFAVPGPITSPLSQGTTSLIKKGAKVVTKIEDILEELQIIKLFPPLAGFRCDSTNCELRKKEPCLEKLNEEEKKIVIILVNENLHIDEIARKLQTEPAKVGGLLSLLEIKGVVRNFGEGVYGLYPFATM